MHMNTLESNIKKQLLNKQAVCWNSTTLNMSTGSLCEKRKESLNFIELRAFLG